MVSTCGRPLGLSPSASCLISSHGLSDPQITKECVSRNHWVKTAPSIVPDNVHSHKGKPTPTSLLTLNPPSQPPECSGPGVARARPGFSSLLVQQTSALNSVHAEASGSLHSPAEAGPPPQASPPGIHKESLKWIPQKSALLPLEGISHQHQTLVLSPPVLTGITATAWH